MKKDEWVNSIVTTKNNWFIIHADKNNYLSWFDVETDFSSSSKKPKIKFIPPIPLIDTYEEKCNGWNKLWNHCYAAYPYYSETLDRVFISGYLSEQNAHIWRTTEIIEQKEEIPSYQQQIRSYIGDSPSLNGVFMRGFKDELFFYDGKNITKLPKPITDYIKDVSSLNGVILRDTEERIYFYDGKNITKLPHSIKSLILNIPNFNIVLFKGHLGEIFIYDGKTITELESDFLISDRHEDWFIIDPIIFGRQNNHTLNQRVLITNLGKNKKSQFLMELKNNYTLESISFPQQMRKDFRRLLQFSGDSFMWTVLRNNILAEIDDSFKTIIATPRYSFIERNILNEETFEFQMKNESNRKMKTQSYYIRKVSPTANCDIILDDNKPVILDP